MHAMPAPPSAPESPAAPEARAIMELLADKAALWESFWTTTAEYIAVIDRQGIIRWCNRVDDGFTLDQVVGHSFVKFTVPESTAALTATLARVFEDGQTHSLETTVRRLDGSFNYFAIHLAPLRRENRIVAILACCENIRPLKATEQELRHERNVLRRLLDIQERERQLVSYEIHDGLAQYLAGGLMHLQACQHACPPEAAAELEAGLRLVQAAAEEARRLIGGLRPPALDELGLVAAVESLADEARTEIGDVAFAPTLPGERLPAAVETTVFRIVQEAIGNARRHSDAGRLRVVLERTDGDVRIVVADDGRGFDPAGVPEDRFGLEGIRQRSRLLGGVSRITTAPGQGTTVEVTLPAPRT